MLDQQYLKRVFRWTAVAALAVSILACNEHSGGEAREALPASCNIDPAVVTGGHRRLALVVGVGEYANRDITDLAGTTVDAKSIHKLLTDPKIGYGFPEENVCLLLDEQATGQMFRKAFDEALVNRAKPGDVAVVYFAGHGSQLWDTNNDEPDQWDETLVFHDALDSETGEIVDDDFHDMLRRLHGKTDNVVTILDSCNSGTATRAASSLVARFVPPTERTVKIFTADGDGSGEWVPQSLPGLVVMTAASDGTPALEQNAKGIFTSALVSVMTQSGGQPLTYAKVARQVPPLVAASSYQVPYFQGDLNQSVFGNAGRTRPVGMDVDDVGPPLKLSGPALPGFGVGAELRVYDDAATGADVTDPSKAKATIIVDKSTDINAEASITGRLPGAADVEAGDLAVLIRPADDFLKLRVSIRPADKPGGVPVARANAILEALAGDAEATMLVDVVDPADDEFELSVAGNGKLVLRGPENKVRFVYDRDRAAVRNLWQHARQKALLRLHGEGGSDFEDQATLKVRAWPAARQPACAKGEWVQAEPNSEQVIPLCHHWNINVKLDESALLPVLIGGFILSTDGSTFGFPADGRNVLINPGEEVTLNSDGETFAGGVPIDIQDHLLVFGTQETNRVQWNLLTETAKKRSVALDAPTSGLHAALDRYLKPGTRGQGVVDSDVENTTWTMSSMTLRVEASDRFKEPDNLDDDIDIREYTIRNFDIRPYLPLDHTSALFKVLTKADELARNSVKGDGYGYMQHDWLEATPEENLAKGIDCSRAIWYAFTSIDLPYNDKQKYIATADMVGDASLMSDEFERCPVNSNFELGDVLVYRSDTRNDGHVVMVIDPGKRIAWGSHGWDGNERDPDYPFEPDTGVEYQLIKYKQHWKRWDRPDMEFKACWRYGRFAEEAGAMNELAGLDGTNPCDDRSCPKRVESP